MKKLLSFVLVCALFASLSATVSYANNEYRDILDEGFVYEADGYSMVVSWCSDGDAKIFGRMWLPGDFDESKTYTTIVMCHGHMGNSDFWDKFYGPALAKEGFVCYAIDCRSAYDGQRDHSTPNDDHVATVGTYARDVIAAVEFVKSKSFVDQNRIYLAGQSMGGMAVQAAASAIPDDIRGLIVLYGFLSESVREMMDCYDEVVAQPYSKGEVLMLGGTLDSACAPENIEQNMALCENSMMALISGARHGFGKEAGRPELISLDEILAFLKRTGENDLYSKNKATSSTAEDLKASEEGYQCIGNNYTFTVHYCGEEGSRVFGRLYQPADFDETKSYPAVIIGHGGNGNCDSWDKVYAPLLSSSGCLVYAIDCRSEASGGRGSYGDPTETGEATVETYSQDMQAALDYLHGLEYVNQEAVYLAGGSFGSAAAQVTAHLRSSELAGLIVISGALGDDNGYAFYSDYEGLKANPYHDGEVLFIQGREDTSSTFARVQENMQWYPDCSLIYISKAGHSFGYQMDRPTLTAVDSILSFVNRTSETGE